MAFGKIKSISKKLRSAARKVRQLKVKPSAKLAGVALIAPVLPVVGATVAGVAGTAAVVTKVSEAFGGGGKSRVASPSPSPKTPGLLDLVRSFGPDPSAVPLRSPSLVAPLQTDSSPFRAPRRPGLVTPIQTIFDTNRAVKQVALAEGISEQAAAGRLRTTAKQLTGARDRLRATVFRLRAAGETQSAEETLKNLQRSNEVLLNLARPRPDQVIDDRLLLISLAEEIRRDRGVIRPPVAAKIPKPPVFKSPF